MDALIVALATAFIAFIGKQVGWPLVKRAWRRLSMPRQSRVASRKVVAELDENLSRLSAVQIGVVEETGGQERRVYRFGSAYSGLPIPDLPILARSALVSAAPVLMKALGKRARVIDNALGALDRYEAIDRSRFREAWRGAMNPVMERMVLDDPGHRTNRANSTFVIDVDKELQAAVSALRALRTAIQVEESE